MKSTPACFAEYISDKLMNGINESIGINVSVYLSGVCRALNLAEMKHSGHTE
jgi:hypothetical protein